MLKNRRVKLIDYNELYNSATDPVILNEMFFDDPSKNVTEAILQRLEGNISFVPRCECGEYQGEIYKGHVCPFCQTLVQSDFTSSFKPVNWVRLPDDAPPVLHPRFYILLTKLGGRKRTKRKGGKLVTSRNKIPIIDYILDPGEILPDDIAEGVHGQGFTYFSEHIDEILTFLLTEHPKLSKSQDAEALMRLYEYESARNNLLIRNLPLLHPIFHPMVVRGKMKKMDKIAEYVMPSVINIAHTSYANRHLVVPKNYTDTELWKIYAQYITYIKKIMEFKIGDKHALIRRHCVAARMHYTARGVISPILDRHMGDELHLPWAIGMMMYQPEVINLLINRHDFSPVEAFDYFYRHVNAYTELLDSIFKDLIKECPSKGLPIFMNRNPTLIPESVRMLYVTKIMTDVNIKVIRLSPRIGKGFNADHDGDEMNIFPIKEQGMVNFAIRTHPKEGILSKTSLSVSSWVKPTVETFIHSNQFLEYAKKDRSPCEMTLPSPDEVKAWVNANIRP